MMRGTLRQWSKTQWSLNSHRRSSSRKICAAIITVLFLLHLERGATLTSGKGRWPIAYGVPVAYLASCLFEIINSLSPYSSLSSFTRLLSFLSPSLSLARDQIFCRSCHRSLTGLERVDWNNLRREKATSTT